MDRDIRYTSAIPFLNIISIFFLISLILFYWNLKDVQIEKQAYMICGPLLPLGITTVATYLHCARLQNINYMLLVEERY